MSIVSLLIVLLVFCVVLWAARSLMGAFGIGDPIGWDNPGNPGVYTNERAENWTEKDGFYYTRRKEAPGPGQGAPHLVHLDEVLSVIGRTYGQTG